jgi:hypothetical protein
MGRKSASGSGGDEQPGSYFFGLRNHCFGFFGVKILKFFDEDPGWKKVGSGIRDNHPGFATLLVALSVPDPSHFGTDPDSSPRIRITDKRIRIRRLQDANIK